MQFPTDLLPTIADEETASRPALAAIGVVVHTDCHTKQVFDKLGRKCDLALKKLSLLSGFHFHKGTKKMTNLFCAAKGDGTKSNNTFFEIE